MSSPLLHDSELVSGDDDGGDGDDYNYDDNVEESSGDAIMQDQAASSTKKAVSAKKPSAGKPDPTSAITSTLAAVSLQSQPKCVRFNLSIGFPVLMSPTGYFRDGQRGICVDFLATSMHFKKKYKVET